MPLYKRKPFALTVQPEDLNPEEPVFQIRFTKEIFRSYNDYLRRINLYNRRFWTCKATGKGSLTYEEALVSEGKALKRIQSIPTEFVAFVLREVQFSMLTLKDLVDFIYSKLQGPHKEGAELYGKKNGCLHPCRILRVIENDQNVQYEIEWLGNDNTWNGNAVVNSEDLTGKSLPFSKRLLKSFIRDSTFRSLPWLLHEGLAKKYGISTSLPEDLKSKIVVLNGNVVNRKRKRSEGKGNTEEKGEKGIKVYKRRAEGNSDVSLTGKSANGGNEDSGDLSMKYPIDDLLVPPSDEDNFLMKRPSPCRKFTVPMDCVGDLLMVWDFCTSYGRLLSLSPFTLEDFENSLCYRDTTPPIIVESCLAFLRLLNNDDGETEDKKRKPKMVWSDSLSDFLETSCDAELSKHRSAIKLGDYSLLEVHVKLAIFQELQARTLETDAFKDKLDEYIEERQALAATRRDEALEEGRRRREEKERRKSEAGAMPDASAEDSLSKKNARKPKVESNVASDDLSNPSKREIHKLMKSGIKEQIETKSAEERKQYLDREIEKRPIRTTALGRDRNCKRYWFFRRDGRVFVESSDFKEWGYYETKEELDALIGSLNIKGVRERSLKKQLQKFYNKICAELKKRLKEATKVMEMEETLVRRSTRVRASPREDPGAAFLKYVNKW